MDSKVQSNVNLALSYNDLQYVPQASLSVADKRTFVKNYSNKKEYSSTETVEVILHGGSAFVDLSQSYLHFKVKCSEASQTTAGGLAFIRNILIQSASGDELERIDNVNILAHNMVNATESVDWKNHFGTMLGYGRIDVVGGLTTTDKDIVIPLKYICGLGNYDQLIPSFLASGLKFLIELETDARALNYGSGAPKYDISDVYIMTENTKLSDSVHKALSAQSANSGLKIEYETFHQTKFTMNSDSGNLDVMKSVSRAQALYAVPQNYAIADEAVTDVMESVENDDISSLQFRTGSVYYPNQPLNNEVEMLYMTNHALGRVKQKNVSNNISLSEFTEGGHKLLAVDLERTSLQMLSAIPLNTSRVLSVDIRFAGSNPVPRTIHTWLKFVRIASVFINNVSVEE